MQIDTLRIVLGIFLSCCCLSSISAQEEIDSAISEVFGDSEPKVPQRQEDNNIVNCECVPFYLCKNDTFNEYGEDLIDIRFGESDCPHYLEKCCSIPSDQRPTEAPIQKPKEHSCGTRHSEGVGFKITGGSDNEANYGEFPWMVAILRRDHVNQGVNLKVMECGGSIIHPQVVLTAAHCVKGKQNLFVRAGEWDTQTDKELYPTQNVDVREIIIHENYYAGGLHNDVALLVLASPLNLTEVVDTLCLPESGEVMDHRTCVVSGWGKDVFGKEGKYQVILKRVEQPVVPRVPCQTALRKTRLGPRFKLHQSFICAGGQIGKDSCKGDGGSPLACPSKNNPSVYVQAGIVAWGIGCGTETPAVYVNIPLMRPWIDNKMATLNFS